MLPRWWTEGDRESDPLDVPSNLPDAIHERPVLAERKQLTPLG
jgi:hypothetical protein